MSPLGFFLAGIGVLFVGLKLTGYITWSWWLVLLPIYGPLAVGVAVLILAGAIATGLSR